MAAYVHEAKSELSKLLDRLLEEGKAVVIVRHGTPVAKLVPHGSEKRVLGSMRGRIAAEKGRDAPIDDREAEERFGL